MKADEMRGRAPRVYAWSVPTPDGRKWQLCHWTEPTRRELLDRGRPCPDAKVVRVWLSVENVNVEANRC